MSMTVTATALFAACATIGAIDDPRHSRSAARESAIALSTGIATHPCGWIAAKITLTSGAEIHHPAPAVEHRCPIRS